MKLYIKRKFSAAHYLPNYDGPCANLHGHTFKVEVWLEGEVNPETGMVIDFKDIKAELDIFDHKCINDVVHYIPTAENIAIDFLDRILVYKAVRSATVRVWESKDAFAELSSSEGDLC